MGELRQQIDAFFAGSVFAVAGASSNRAKYGNKVFRAYLEHGYTAFPVNPNEAEVEGHEAYENVLSLPQKVHGLSVVTPPRFSRHVITQAAEAGIEHVWLQPGAEDASVFERARELGVELIAGGPCVLVEIGGYGARR